ncbi:MAG: NADH-quinone oxidoreductase subunit C [Planctomycetes bacterium]|nr:NADH-quinone oxidoreductase subunit C [Planctomycetota bacterium]
MDVATAAVEKITALFTDTVIGTQESCGQKFVEVQRDRIVDLLTFLKNDAELSFECLMDLTAIDGLNQGAPERFCVVYHLYSFRNNGFLRIKAYVPEGDPWIDSVSGVWKSAAWAEREVYDLFGIQFPGHPDLKRLLLPEYLTGHPLRKDYPLRGLGERDNFPRYVGGA